MSPAGGWLRLSIRLLALDDELRPIGGDPVNFRHHNLDIFCRHRPGRITKYEIELAVGRFDESFDVLTDDYHVVKTNRRQVPT
jgi:hypothetical protein